MALRSFVAKTWHGQNMLVCTVVPLSSEPEQLHHILLQCDVLNLAREMLLSLDIYMSRSLEQVMVP